jgi:hypothetical protein
MTTIYERLRALQISLPELSPPVVDGYVPSFVPFVRALLFICRDSDVIVWIAR